MLDNESKEYLLDVFRSRAYTLGINHEDVFPNHLVHLHVHIVRRTAWVVGRAVLPKVDLHKVVVELLCR